MNTLLNAMGKRRNAMIVYRGSFGFVTAARAVATLGVIVLAAVLSSSSPVQAQDSQQALPTDEASEVNIGLKISPVPLNLAGKNRNLVGLGSYIVNARSDCNSCHTGGGPPNFNYAAGGNPYFGQPAKIDARFSVSRTHEHTALLGHQRKHMTWPHEVGRPHVAIGKRADGVGAFFGGNPGGQSVARVDRNGEGGAERRVVARHHRIEVQTPRLILGERRADDAGGMANDERHLLGRTQRGGDEQVAFVLAVVVVCHDD